MKNSKLQVGGFHASSTEKNPSSQRRREEERMDAQGATLLMTRNCKTVTEHRDVEIIVDAQRIMLRSLVNCIPDV